MPEAPVLGIPAPGEAKRGVDGHISYLLRQASGAVRLKLERSLGEVGATLPQFVVMTMLKAYPGISGAELARVALLTPQTIGVITRNLERLGAIYKQRHPSHGRLIQLALTPSGEALLGQCRQRADIIESGIVVGLSPEEEAVIRRWLVGFAAE